MIEVAAIRDGHYGGRIRRPRDKFTIEKAADFSSRWMVKKGTPAYDAFMSVAPEKPEKDGITGERISAGGVAEELSIVVAENSALKARIAELEDRLKGAQAAVPEEPTPSPEELRAGSSDGDQTNTTVTRRRRSAK